MPLRCGELGSSWPPARPVAALCDFFGVGPDLVGATGIAALKPWLPARTPPGVKHGRRLNRGRPQAAAELANSRVERSPDLSRTGQVPQESRQEKVEKLAQPKSSSHSFTRRVVPRPMAREPRMRPSRKKLPSLLGDLPILLLRASILILPTLLLGAVSCAAGSWARTACCSGSASRSRHASASSASSAAAPGGSRSGRRSSPSTSSASPGSGSATSTKTGCRSSPSRSS